MRVVVACVALSSFALGACDSSFPAHVSGRILFGAKPLAGIVVALGTPMGGQLDAAGRFDVTYERLNVSPWGIPLLVIPQGARPIVLQPPRDFSLVKRRGVWVGVIDLDASAKPARPIPVTCVAAECTAFLPPEARSCETAAVALQSPVPVSREEKSTAAGTEISFRAGAGGVVVVSVCAREKEDFISDVIVGTAPSDARAP